ncbi:MAG: hypothetical protein QOF51_2783 [Chloroflexota bacterium]|nr:hypothetical protein [Chloroflexota bacterium]
MPTYVYRCQQCGAEIERRQSFTDDPLTECESCHGELRRVLQPVAVFFKGSGFYSTDYRNSNTYKAAAKAESDQGSSTPSSAPEAPASSTTTPTPPATTTATPAPAPTSTPAKSE